MAEAAILLARLEALPVGASEGIYEGRRWSAALERSADGKRWKLYAEELGGNDHVSFNLYLTEGSGPLLKPCEMPAEKVIRFVEGYRPDGR